MQTLFKKIIIASTFFVIFIASFSPFVSAQESYQHTYVQANILNKIHSETIPYLYQAEISSGEKIEINSFGQDLDIGSRVFLEYSSENDSYMFLTVNRNSILFSLLLLFVVTMLVLAGKKGVRSFLGLTLSIGMLFFAYIPLLLAGYNPILLTIIFGFLVLIASIFITHGFHVQSISAFLGSLISIFCAIGIVLFVIRLSSLTGYIGEGTQYLAQEFNDAIDLVRIVSAGIIIGIFGVLDDVTITQVAVVRELSINTDLSKRDIFLRALGVGQDHIASLVNTLVFAYVGATLPLVMFMSIMQTPWYILLSHEFIFIEIVRSLVGAIALALAVPLTTFFASYIFLNKIKKNKTMIHSACAHHH